MTMHRFTTRVVVLVIGLSGSMLFAGDAEKSKPDWPQWRGPHRDGVAEETGLLQKWESQGPPLAWKTSGLGEGYATVAIAEGKIFTTGKRKDAVYVIARDGSDGHELWATRGRRGTTATLPAALLSMATSVLQ